jgi:hypothetical protein
MALLDTGENDIVELSRTHRRHGHRRAGVVLTGLGVGFQSVFLVWWLSHLPLNPIAFAVLATELVGVVNTVAITTGLVRARQPREVFIHDHRESHRFAFAVADIVGRTRSTDVHRDVARAVRTVSHRPPRRSAEAAMGGVLLEGPRRLVLVVALSVGLVVGTAPMPVPPWWAIVAAGVGALLVAASHVAVGGGRIRFGDRTRWSYSSIGEVVGAADLDGLAPRRWVGTMASIVVVNLAIALRGTSDRWTHGLAPMADDDRVVTMLMAIVVVAAALFTMRTIQEPDLDEARWSRRLEERTARQSALGATVVLGLIGLFAGVLPGGVDAADDDPVRVEQLVDDQAGSVDG